MTTALESAPNSLPIDAETVLELVPSKALLFEGPTPKPCTERAKIRIRRFVRPLLRNLGLMKSKRHDKPLSHHLNEAARLLGNGPFELDKSCEIASDSDDIRQTVNNTRNQFWLKSVRGEPIAETQLKSGNPSVQTMWPWKNLVVAPVYRYQGGSETNGLVSVLPSSLLIKPAPVYQKKTRQLDRLLATRFGLVYQATISRYLAGFRYYLIKTPVDRQHPGFTAIHAWQELQKPEYKQFVEHCELDIVPHYIPTANTTGPNDPYYDGTVGTQWNLDWIKAKSGWDHAGWSIDNSTFEPGKDVVVAVIDSGIDLDHPDFESRSALVPGATFKPGTNFDDKAGEGPVEVDEDPETGGSESDDPHGTFCAGIIGARSNNNQGIAGLAGACKIMPIAINGYYKSTVAAAINWAAAHGADVISMSFGGDIRTKDFLNGPVMDAAIKNGYACKKVVICAATMNQNEPKLYYPASHPNVLACGASSKKGDKNSRSQSEWPITVGTGSNFGAGIDVVAPGTDIATTIPRSRNGASPYTSSFNGTSAATPHVAGLAALLISAYPDKLRRNPSEVYRIIKQSARQSAAPDMEVGHGCIDVLEAFIIAERDHGKPTWPNYRS